MDVARGIASKSMTVSTSPSTLFRSDSKGKSDTINAIYNLEVNPNQDSGHYSTGLVYTIVTL